MGRPRIDEDINKNTRITFIVNRTSTYLDKWLEDENGFLIENPKKLTKKSWN